VDDYLAQYRRFWEGSYDRLDEYLRTSQNGSPSDDPGSE